MRIPPEKGTYLFSAFFICLVFIVAAPGYMAWEAETLTITDIRVPDVPEGIVFIADPHVRSENIDMARKVVTEINRRDPTLVLIGGDFTSQDEEDLSLQAVWAEIDAPVYAVLGNHDYRSGIQGSGARGRVAWILESGLRSEGYYGGPLYSDPDVSSADTLEEVLEENGVTVLRNEWRELDIEGQKLIICGVDDIWAGRADPPILPDTGAQVIYLVHEPIYREEWNADLILSGHTHGGQVSNGAFIVLDGLGLADIQGISMKRDTVMYVSRGIGTSREGNDYRFFVPPEIVVINPRAG